MFVQIRSRDHGVMVPAMAFFRANDRTRSSQSVLSLLFRRPTTSRCSIHVMSTSL